MNKEIFDIVKKIFTFLKVEDYNKLLKNFKINIKYAKIKTTHKVIIGRKGKK